MGFVGTNYHPRLIYGGLASPTVSGNQCHLCTFVSMVIYKTVEFKDFKDYFHESLKIYAPILFVLCSALAFSRILTILQVPQQLGNWVQNYLNSKQAILGHSLNSAFVGMVMDTSAAILILAPIFCRLRKDLVFIRFILV